MGLHAQRGFRLRLTDFDRHGRLHPAAVLGLLQDISAVQVSEMGMGIVDLAAEGYLWAVTRIRYEAQGDPAPHQEVMVRTWPHTLSRFSWLRDCVVSNAAGEVLVRASSEWVLIDAQTRKFASVRDVYQGPEDFETQRVFPSKPRKLRDFSAEGIEPYRVVPSYSDVDFNGHVNNSRYASYVVDSLSPGPGRPVRSFQMDFRREVLEGQPLRVFTKQEGDVVRSKGLDEDDGVMFACELELG